MPKTALAEARESGIWDEEFVPDEPANASEGSTEDLLEAMTVALTALGRGSGETERKRALRESFGHARVGLRAKKALLLYVARHEPLDLQILQSRGLAHQQLVACRELRSCEGVSPSVIRQTIEGQRPVFIPNAQAQGDAQQTASLATGTHSVLCAPVLEPMTGAVLAVLYFENQGLEHAFEESHLKWLASYAAALSQGLGMHLSAERRIEELEKDRVRLQRGRGDAPEIIGEGDSTRRLRGLLHETFIPEIVDRSPKPILILGPSGTGKDLIARYLHYYSAVRGKARYVAYNCAGLRSGDMTKSILFGHMRGSFTGAIKDSPGLFRDANKGILFLDEIGDMPLDGQAELLRAIQESRVTPLGSSEAIPVDVQLITATNRDLAEEVRSGRFRDDLYYRINVHRIRLAPLANPSRRGDIRPLLTHFLAAQEHASKKKTAGLTPEALKALLAYTWPGNVRELENVCTVLVTYARPGATIDLNDIQVHCHEVLQFGARRPDADILTDEEDAPFEAAQLAWEREFLRTRIERCDGNQTRAAKSLGLHYSTLMRKMERSGLPGAMSKHA